MTHEDLLTEAKVKTARYCAYQERSPKQVFNKLSEFPLSDVEIQAVYLELVDKNFVDERRFVESFVHGKFHLKKWGKVKIRYELRGHDVSDELIEIAISTIDEEDYRNTAQGLIDNKLNSLRKEVNSSLVRQKVIRHMYSKGYEFEIIDEVLNSFRPQKPD